MKLIKISLLSFCLIGSNPKEQYITLMDKFMKANQLSFEFRIVENVGNQSRQSKGYFKRSDNLFLLKNENYTVLAAKELTLTIMEDEKSILLDETTAPDNLFFVNANDMRQAVTSVVETINSTKLIKEWVITGKGWDAKGIIKADIDKNIPLEISYFLKNDDVSKTKPQLKINFYNVLTSTVDKSHFNVSSYIQKKANKWVLTSKYSNYELINNLD